MSDRRNYLWVWMSLFGHTHTYHRCQIDLIVFKWDIIIKSGHEFKCLNIPLYVTWRSLSVCVSVRARAPMYRLPLINILKLKLIGLSSQFISLHSPGIKTVQFLHWHTLRTHTNYFLVGFRLLMKELFFCLGNDSMPSSRLNEIKVMRLHEMPVFLFGSPGIIINAFAWFHFHFHCFSCLIFGRFRWNSLIKHEKNEP